MNEIDDFGAPSGDDEGSIWINNLFESARSPGTAEELSSAAAVVGAMMRTIAEPPLVSDIDARRRLRVSKTAARTAIVAAALLVGTSTAAATGNLPDAAQSAVARASSHFGIDIPDPHDEPRRDEHAAVPPTDAPTTPTVLDDAAAGTVPVAGLDPTASDTSTASPSQTLAVPASTDAPNGPQPAQPGTAPTGPDATGPAKKGLCRAWAAQGGDSPAKQNSTAMKNLQAAAAAAGQTVEEFCADVLGPDSPEAPTPTSEATPTTPGEDDGNKKDKKQPDEDGKEKPKKEKEEKEPKSKS